MGRTRGLLISIGGIVLIILGLGMWQSPEINWGGFIAAWSSIMGEIGRLIDDPFAILGILVLIIGIFVAVHGIRRLVQR